MKGMAERDKKTTVAERHRGAGGLLGLHSITSSARSKSMSAT
jgi:hypothetical protein